MADKAGLIVTQNGINPDSWTEITVQLRRVLHEYHCDHIRLPLLSPQENVIIERLAVNYIVCLRLLTLRGIQESWDYRWFEQLFNAALKGHARVDWYPESGRVMSVPAWYCSGAILLIVIKDRHDPRLYQWLMQAAADEQIPIIRIDPDTIEVKKVLMPTTKEDSG